MIMETLQDETPTDLLQQDVEDADDYENIDALFKGTLVLPGMGEDDDSIIEGLLKDPDTRWDKLGCEEDSISKAAIPIAMEKQTLRRSERIKRPRGGKSEHYVFQRTCRAKRSRGTGVRSEQCAVQRTGSDKGSELSPVEVQVPNTPPPSIVQLHPSLQSSIHHRIQVITLPESPGYQFVLSPPVFTLPLSILVPAPSPSCGAQVPPLSPVDGAVAPALLVSFPQGSLSDTTSKALSPNSTLPVSPSSELSPSRESPLPPSPLTPTVQDVPQLSPSRESPLPPSPLTPTVQDVPHCVRDCIQQAKAHVKQTFQEMDVGASLTSHYVDVQLVERTILCSGKSTHRFLEKELVPMGESERQQNSVRRNQIFVDSARTNPKRYVLLIGNAGMGKTSLIRKLCLDWSSDSLPQFDFVFLLDGKSLKLTEPTYSLHTLLLRLSPTTAAWPDPGCILTQVLKAPKRLLIIFDGFEELRDYEALLQQSLEKEVATSLQKDTEKESYTVRQLYSAILQRVLLPGSTLLISSRPRGLASMLLRRADSLLELCGFGSAEVQGYLSRYFCDPALRASAVDRLESSRYMHSLCWNPGLCRLVCSVLEHYQCCKGLPSTLTGLCHQALRVRVGQGHRNGHADTQTRTVTHSRQETLKHKPGTTRSQRHCTRTQNNVRTRARTRAQVERIEEKGKEDGDGGGEDFTEEEGEFLSQLSSLAWDGIRNNSSLVPVGRSTHITLRTLGLRMGLFHCHHPRRGQGEERGGGGERGGEEKKKKRRGRPRTRGGGGSDEMQDNKFNAVVEDYILSWANPFFQSFLAAVHLSMSRTVSDRAFLHLTVPFQSGPRVRRQTQREELDLTQRLAVGLLFLHTAELQKSHLYTDTPSMDTVVAKRTLVREHMEGVRYGDLSPPQLLEACHYIHEAGAPRGDGGRNRCGVRLLDHLARNLPETLMFGGVPLCPPDVLVLGKVLEQAGAAGRRFCLGAEETGIRLSGLKALLDHSCIHTYRVCIAGVIALWEELDQTEEEPFLKGAVSKFKLDPMKATQLCHLENLAKLVDINTYRRLMDSSSQSEIILAEGVPAVRELRKLELELGPENGPLALPALCQLLPGLHSLQHLDLENNKLGDMGVERLAVTLVSLSALEILNLSQNNIGDEGMEKLACALKTLPSLHSLSLYSNVISDEGAESLAAVLPQLTSLSDVDVKYNKFTDVGAQSLGSSLKHCPSMKSLRIWNQCIPYGVFEHLQQQDHRIICH